MDNEDQYILDTIIVNVIVCGNKFLIFYNVSEEGGNVKGREWKNFVFGVQLECLSLYLTVRL
jgi:hypothetical protein